MNIHAEHFKASLDRLLVDVKLEKVAFHQIQLDRELKIFCESFNLLSTLKPSSDDGFESSASILLDSYQVPLLVSKTEAGYYRLISGLLTFQKLCKIYTVNDKSLVPCLVLPRRPNKEILRLLILNDLVRPLLKQFVDVTGDTITQTLSTLFTSVANPSVFNSPQWQSLFPMIKTKTQLCEWLHISTKTVKLK
ncbi:Uncharacterised protein [Shewanella putrefaciens]|uniref:Uncharacterized protein n=1 Tax=Shewanella decolorationis TaxID=256839 RepID=A0A5B8QXR8_9GAMM|nr:MULTISPECIES: hypothetical protein [Shewanella]MCU8072168.1 hypothetical protein [Shewanella sp. SM32]PZP34938.1 MAG: hypothetical protein DI594_07350 [Shewanella oneidensis]QDZ90818.1 hypothetical protein D0436_10260 [Shewanella decolorationis]VEE64239.1 Uncharacterised protein [Shewanella putrefaciens]